MRVMNFVIFFSVFFLIYFSISYYVFLRGWQGIASVPELKQPYIFIFIYFSFAYILMRFLGKFLPDFITTTLYWSGSFWFAGLLFLFISILFIDILRLLNLLIPFFPHWIIINMAKVRLYTTYIIASFVFLLLLGGHINTLILRVRELNLSIQKPLSEFKSITIAMVSDIHMGTLIGRGRLEQMVGKINVNKPDLVIFAGDLLDEIQEPIFKHDIGAPIRNLYAPFGVYGITGNHEYIGGIESAVKYIETLGVKMLRDTTIKINNQFYLTGREDRSKGGRFSGEPRKALPELLKNIDFKDPVILLDHQPFHFDDAVNNKVDLQLSGHTHYGQFWPISSITKAIYELSWGYVKKADTHFYVSNGFGTWGPPVRIGNRPEIVIIHLINTANSTK
jgi:predicted MPP superfamily phosphohydrolase